MPTAPCTRRGVCDSNWLLSVDGPLPPPQLSPRGGSFPTPFQRRACRRAAAVAALNNGLLRLGAKMQVRPVEPKQSLGIAALVRARIDAPLLQAVVDPWMPSCRTLDQCTARPARSSSSSRPFQLALEPVRSLCFSPRELGKFETGAAHGCPLRCWPPDSPHDNAARTTLPPSRFGTHLERPTRRRIQVFSPNEAQVFFSLPPPLFAAQAQPKRSSSPLSPRWALPPSPPSPAAHPLGFEAWVPSRRAPAAARLPPETLRGQALLLRLAAALLFALPDQAWLLTHPLAQDARNAHDAHNAHGSPLDLRTWADTSFPQPPPPPPTAELQYIPSTLNPPPHLCRGAITIWTSISRNTYLANLHFWFAQSIVCHPRIPSPKLPSPRLKAFSIPKPSLQPPPTQTQAFASHPYTVLSSTPTLHLALRTTQLSHPRDSLAILSYAHCSSTLPLHSLIVSPKVAT
ncbi:hypothetical protein PaG_03455 [Moesziomyces aphidis]|uniref:Uncharacterized protein n=1 Tax=Moesziomyces aphidis TaxID=84754 RepID=W3VLI4_MOEAP|nr:hypothetical protein PaG_03455 [Moesziomyces aphidis]